MGLKLPRIDLERIKLVAELAAAIAVVLSLVFVGLQVRESALQTQLNTAAIEVSAYQDLMAQIAEFNRLGIENPDVARIQSLESASLSSLTPIERRRHVAVSFMVLRHGDMAHLQFERGMLDEERMHSVMAPLRAWLRYCYVREVWANNRNNFAPNYRRYVDGIITSSSNATACAQGPAAQEGQAEGVPLEPAPAPPRP